MLSAEHEPNNPVKPPESYAQKHQAIRRFGLLLPFKGLKLSPPTQPATQQRAYKLLV
jgi:hypothetical protein